METVLFIFNTTNPSNVPWYTFDERCAVKKEHQETGKVVFASEHNVVLVGTVDLKEFTLVNFWIEKDERALRNKDENHRDKNRYQIKFLFKKGAQASLESIDGMNVFEDFCYNYLWQARVYKSPSSFCSFNMRAPQPLYEDGEHLNPVMRWKRNENGKRMKDEPKAPLSAFAQSLPENIIP